MKKLLQLILAGLLSVVTLASCGGADNDDIVNEIKTENAFGGVHGVAIDAENQEPMRGVNVQLCKEAGSIIESTVTFDDGHFEFTKVAPGSYTIVVSSTKYPNVEYDFAVEAGRTSSFDVPMGLHVNPYMPIYITNVDKYRSNYTDYITMSINIPESDKLDILEKGFYYSTKDNPMAIGEKGSYYSGWGCYGFPGDPKTMYYVQAYVKDKKGDTYLSEIVRISLILVTPSVETSQVYKSNNKVYCEGKITHAGNPKYSERGFIISTEHNSPTISDVDDSETKKYVVEGDESTYKLYFSDFVEGKTYHVRAYATNEIGTDYGSAIMYDGLDWYIQGNLMVQKVNLGECDWNSANQLCKDSRLGGYSDWRLPTYDELKIIWAKGWLNNGEYWSSTKYTNDKYYTIFKYDGSTYDGNTYHVLISLNRCVRAVRTITE